MRKKYTWTANYTNFGAPKGKGSMKRYYKAIFFFSFLAFFFAGSASVVTVAQTRQGSSTFSSGFHTGFTEFSSTGQTADNIYSIRHRSALQNEDIVVRCHSEVKYIKGDVSNSMPGYFSRWNTYFYSLAEILPLQQTLPPSFGLRAPPFSF